MSPFVSRIVVAAILLPVVLGVVWLGGWWLFGLALVGGLLALHELYAMARGLRPIVLGGYAGLVLTLLGAQLGGTDVAARGHPVDPAGRALLVFFVSSARQNAVAGFAVTLLGVAWVGGGLAHLMLVRDIPVDGRLLVFTILLTVFADDTAAFFVGRAIGRHRLAPAISPGKSWEGFVGGTLAGVAVTFFALYEQDVVTTGESLILGPRHRPRGDARRPVRVGGEARPRRQGLRAPARRARRRARPGRLAPLGRAGGLRRPARAGVTGACTERQASFGR